MKRLILTILLSFLFVNIFAAHIKGGFFTYKYLGPGITDPNKLRYKVTLTVYMSCVADGQQINDPINFSVYRGSTSNLYENRPVFIKTQYTVGKQQDEPCVTGNQIECYYKIIVYELNNYELPVSADGYTFSYERCCRINNMDNVNNSGDVGNTYNIRIPGTASPVADANKNSSPEYPINDTVVVCEGSYFEYPFKAKDPDGDSLVYTLCSAFTGASSGAPAPDISSPPPYAVVPYTFPYSGINPMGNQVKIDNSTGLISGIAPNITRTGEYVVTVCVSEYRNNVYFTESRKELHIKVRDCVPLLAKLNPIPVTCDGFTVGFSNSVPNPTGTDYVWIFGDPASGSLDTSYEATPTHTYTDTGVYILKLRVSINGLCADSTTSPVKVYPGFFPGFKTTGPLCKGVPVQFQDTTKTKYGVPTGWGWNFGDPPVTNDTSHLQNPTYTYAETGTYNVRFIVGNTKGCIDTIFQDVTILASPPLVVSPKDTIYCAKDTIGLSAIGIGIFSWSPATNIIGANTATPKVYPAATTTYTVTLNNLGCIGKDSVIVRPLNDLTAVINASNSQICEEDTITLTGSSNHSPVSWLWTPAATVRTPATQTTFAYPSSTSNYTLTTRWGNNCTSTTSKTITVKSLATPVISPATPFCAGQGSAQLNVTGGDSFTWTPSEGLSSAVINNPVATPATTTTYTVAAAVNGCSQLRKASVLVTVRDLPLLTVTNDTLICSIDTLKLTATGNGTVAWTPNYTINNQSSFTPLVSPDVATTYHVTLTDANGCISRDSVWVDVRQFITIDAGKDTTICATDSITFHPISDALKYTWTPATGLNNPAIKNPIANPLTPQLYHVVANLGKCQDDDDIMISVVPYPVANAGNDTSLCFGASTQLNGSGGNSYQWSPATFLSATNIANPLVIKPVGSTTYILTVKDILGCPKPVYDSVLVNVEPLLIADAGPSDTTLVLGEPLFLNGTGGGSYLWSPPQWLNNANIADPIASPKGNIQYNLLVTSPAGCTATDSIRIKVYRVPPDLYVPTAFTPNRDGLNDDFKPIVLGMKTLAYFRIYNRWGQLLFSTSTPGKAWDGTYKGQPQDQGTYVWMTEGISYEGKLIARKGYVVLIR